MTAGTSSDSVPRSCIVIPARLESTRLPRKLLLRETGKSLLRHTYEAASQAELPETVLVAADHAELAEEVKSFGGNVELTDPLAENGTDRVAEIANLMGDFEVFVNVQGDEPEISARSIDQLVHSLAKHPDTPMATLATPIHDRRRLDDPNCVKVVFDNSGRAMYFSRSAVPFARDWSDDYLSADPPMFYQHLGIYAYRREFLLKIPRLPKTRLEQLEGLEQLRVLEAGYSIQIAVVNETSKGIDTEDDYAEFVKRFENGAISPTARQGKSSAARYGSRV